MRRFLPKALAVSSEVSAMVTRLQAARANRGTSAPAPEPAPAP